MVHVLPSVQLEPSAIGVLAHVPVVQLSAVHVLPSSQSMAVVQVASQAGMTSFEHMPVAVAHKSLVHGLPSLHWLSELQPAGPPPTHLLNAVLQLPFCAAAMHTASPVGQADCVHITSEEIAASTAGSPLGPHLLMQEPAQPNGGTVGAQLTTQAYTWSQLLVPGWQLGTDAYWQALFTHESVVHALPSLQLLESVQPLTGCVHVPYSLPQDVLSASIAQVVSIVGQAAFRQA